MEQNKKKVKVTVKQPRKAAFQRQSMDMEGYSIENYVRQIPTSKLLEVLWDHGREDGIKYPEKIIDVIAQELKKRRVREKELLTKIEKENSLDDM